MAFDDAAAPRTQTLLSQIVASLTDGIAVHDGPHLVEANTPLAHLLGFADADALLSADPDQLCAHVELFDDSGQRILPHELWHARVRRAGDRTVRLRHADGTTRWVAVRQRQMQAVEHEWIVTTVRDITDARAAAQWPLVLDSITDPFVMLDDELRVVTCNQSAARLVGVAAHALIGERLWDAVPASPQLVQGCETALVKRRSLVVEDHVVAWQRWYEINIYPLEAGIALQWKDTTVRKQALELTARLGRHAAVRAEISAVLAEERELLRMLRRACEALVEELDLTFARVWLDDPTQPLQLQGHAGAVTAETAIPIDKIAATHQPQFGDIDGAAFAGYPLLVDHRAIGVIAMASRQALAGDTATTLGAIADLIAQGIQRRRAELELERCRAELAKLLRH